MSNEIYVIKDFVERFGVDYTAVSYGLSTKLIEHKCASCGIDKWFGQKVRLEMDHIDGNWKNNDINNLRLLCPNCHSITPTYGTKKLSKMSEENIREITQMIEGGKNSRYIYKKAGYKSPRTFKNAVSRLLPDLYEKLVDNDSRL